MLPRRRLDYGFLVIRHGRKATSRIIEWDTVLATRYISNKIKKMHLDKLAEKAYWHSRQAAHFYLLAKEGSHAKL